MDIQQAVNLALLCQFRERGSTFAYPTQTLRLVSSGNGKHANIADKSAA